MTAAASLLVESTPVTHDAIERVRLLGADAEVPCHGGRHERYVDLDYAASTSALPAVWQAVEDFAPWSSSVHRGSGLKSRWATQAYEAAREVVHGFVGARPTDEVVLVRNTTEAVNVVAAGLPEGARILSTPVEHHANLLPWRRHHLELLPFPSSADDLCRAAEDALAGATPRFDLLAVTGASNVTGEVWPLERLARIAHRHGARLFVDAAQLAPHRRIDLAGSGVDLVAFSGHKLYAPFGAGALVGDLGVMTATAPLLRGGGAVKLVTRDGVIWATGSDRHEAGSPNLVGVIALAAACRSLLALGMDEIAAHERRLTRRLRAGLERVVGLRMLTLWPGDGVDRVGVATFKLAGYRHPRLAAVLSWEHAIGVRHGCFCAHPLIAHLLGIDRVEIGRLGAELESGRRPALPGAVRASLGLGSTAGDVDRLVGALESIARRGPESGYRYDDELDEYEPLAG